MNIQELVCRADGTQVLQNKEVPDGFFDVSTPEPTAEERLLALESAMLAMMG